MAETERLGEGNFLSLVMESSAEDGGVLHSQSLLS